ncbi:hypothetical protein NX059_009874 [Plenodomus lindquistii]|nr:hypothetical protein NX059_009874 [Plenodomus lindquistii]
MPHSILLPTGAGNQARAVIPELLAHGHTVHFLTRNPSSESAKEQQARGAIMHEGDLSSISSIESAMKDVDAVFLSLPGSFDSAAEVDYGRNVISAAKKQNIQTFIYTSVARAGEHESFPGWSDDHPFKYYWGNKHELQNQVRNAGFKHWTILQPALFMQNYARPTVEYSQPELPDAHELRVRYNPDTKLDILDVRDIAKFAVAALESPEKFSGKSVRIAGESVTPQQLADILSGISGHEVKVHYMSEEEAEKKIAEGNTLPLAMAWHRDVGYGVDVEAVKQWGVPLTPLSKALDKETLGW